jgi:hypothetical protein
MKKGILIVAFLAYTIVVTNAQSFWAGTNDTGTIVLNDNSTLQGTVYFQALQNDRIRFVDAAGKDKVYFAGNITKFNLGIYHFKSIQKGSTYIGENSGFFVEIQNNADTSKAKIAFLHSENKEAKPMNPAGYRKQILAIFSNGSYYIPLKGNLPPINKLFPKYLTDCPELAKKVDDKEKGYSFKGMFTSIEPIFIKIINEYNNNCQPIEEKK